MKRALILTMFICGMFLFSGLSHADDSYVSVYVGAAVPHDSDAVTNTGTRITGTVSFDAGVSFGAKVGHWFREYNAPYFGMEIDVNANFVTVSYLDNITLPGVGSDLYGDADADVKIYSQAVNALLRYPNGKIMPYVGVGIVLLEAQIEGGTALGSQFQGDKTETHGWQFLAGVNVPFNSTISFFTEYKYTKTGNKFKFDDPIAIALDVNYKVSQIHAGVSFNF